VDGRLGRSEVDADFMPEDVIEVSHPGVSDRSSLYKTLSDPVLLYVRVRQRSSLEEGSAAAFLHQSYIECFSDISELAEAALCLSDASHFVDAYRRRPWQTPLLPYVASLAGRGVVTCNQNPLPSRRLQICKPQVFAVERELLERKRRTALAFQRPKSDARCFHTAAVLATDVLPMLSALMRSNMSSVSPHLGKISDDSLRSMQLFVEGHAAGGHAHVQAAQTSITHQHDEIEEDE
jgi:hypothetical protein